YPWCEAALRDRAYVQSMMGKPDEARDTIQRHRQLMLSWSAETAKSQARHLEAELAYAAGDPHPFIDASVASKDPHQRIMGRLTSGDVAAAHAESARLKPDATTDLL